MKNIYFILMAIVFIVDWLQQAVMSIGKKK